MGTNRTHELAKVWVIARFDLGTALRTRRAVLALLMYLLIALGTGLAAISIERRVQQALSDRGTHPEVLVEAKAKALTALTIFLGGDREKAEHLMGIPLPVAAFFFVTLTFLPYLIALTSHDLVNRELRDRSARFVLLRASRATFLAGKTLSHVLLFMVVTVVSNAALFAYAALELPAFPIATGATTLTAFWGYALVYGVCFLSLAALVSSFVDSAARSLIALVVVLVALNILAASDTAGFLSPWAHRGGLWSPHALDVAQSLAWYLGFSAAFWTVAWLRIRRRDV